MRTFHCSGCDEVKTEPIEKLAHTWNNEYTIDKEATEAEEGQKSIHCSVCGEVKTDTIKTIPKKETNKNIKPDTGSNGKTNEKKK